MNNEISRPTRLGAMAAIGLSAILFAHTIFAQTGHAATPASDAQLTQKECGACHYPFARDWLPAYSWKQILEHLDDHFGENASLAEPVRKRIQTYLIGDRPATVPTRVTDSDWWLRAHGGESIKTYAEQNGFKASNCEKCHR